MRSRRFGEFSLTFEMLLTRENLDWCQKQSEGGGAGGEEKEQETPQDFRYFRSPAKGENVVPDWLINCQKIRLSVNIYRSFS